MLNAGKSYIEHIPQNKIQQFVNSRHFSASNDFAKVREADAILICVPTPLDERREPDLSYVEQTADRKSTRLNSSHSQISYAVFCLKKKNNLTTALARSP